MEELGEQEEVQERDLKLQSLIWQNMPLLVSGEEGKQKERCTHCEQELATFKAFIKDPLRGQQTAHHAVDGVRVLNAGERDAATQGVQCGKESAHSGPPERHTCDLPHPDSKQRAQEAIPGDAERRC